MTAPISNGPATTRLHHYAGHYWIMCESEGPPARRRAQAASTPRRTAPLNLSAHTWSSFARTPGIEGYSYPHDETTNFNVAFPALTSRKVDVSPTHFVHPQSWPPTTLNQTFPHHKAEKSGSDQLFLSFNPVGLIARISLICVQSEGLNARKNVSVMTRVCGLLSGTSSRLGGVRSRFVSIYVGVSRIIRV